MQSVFARICHITACRRMHNGWHRFEQGADALERRAHSSQNENNVCCSVHLTAWGVCLEWGPPSVPETLSGRPSALGAAEAVLGNTLKTSAGARPPPSARTVSLKRRPVSFTALLSSSPASSNALKASADSTSAHLYEKYPAAEQAHNNQVESMMGGQGTVLHHNKALTRITTRF